MWLSASRLSISVSTCVPSAATLLASPPGSTRSSCRLRAQDPPLVWGDVDARGGEELWWLLPSGLNELDRLEARERRGARPPPSAATVHRPQHAREARR